MESETEEKSKMPPECNIEYVITAQFDNKYGHTLKYQYPKCIPGFGASNENKNGFYLANLMMPSNIEHDLSTGADFTIFMLYLNKSTGNYELFPSADCDPEDTLFFLNVVIAQANRQDARGANIKAIAAGSKLKCFKSFKTTLQSTLENLMPCETYDETLPFLIDLYNSINSIDLSIVKRIHDNRLLQNVFSGISSEDALRSLLDAGAENKYEVLQFLKVPDRDKYGNKIGIIKGHLCITFDAYVQQEQFKKLRRSPLVIDLIQGSPIDLEIKYHGSISKFMVKMIPLLRKNRTGNSSFKIVINSNILPKNEICQFVMALANLMNCHTSEFGSQYYRNGPFVVLPYTEVGMIDLIKQYFASFENIGVFAIVGTANPMFKLKHDLWDYYYDMDKDSIYLSNKNKSLNANKRWDAMPFKKMLNRRYSTILSPAADSCSELSLMGKSFELISQEKPDNATAIKFLRKMHLYHLMDKKFFKSEYSLEEFYSIYKDFVVFDYFHDIEAIKAVQFLDNLSEVTNSIFEAYNDSESHFQPTNPRLMTKLNEVLHEVHNFLIKGNNIEKFMNICMLYPFVTTHIGACLVNASNGNSNRDFMQSLQINSSWLRLVDGKFTNTAIGTIVKDRSLNFLVFPLLLNSNIKDMPQVFRAADETQTSNINERPRSTAFKWMLNLTNHKTNDSSMEGSSIKSGSEAYSISSVSTTKLVSSCISNNSSLSINMDYEELEQLVIIAKNVALKILQLIEGHVMGKLMIKENLHPYFQLIYESMKLQQRNDFANYEMRLSKTEHSFKSIHNGLSKIPLTDTNSM